MGTIDQYTNLLFDLDNTLLDFSKAEDYAIRKLALDYGITLDDEKVQTYVLINEKYWHLLDSGKMTKSDILRKRFEEFFRLFDLDVDGQKCDDTYRNYLTDEVFLVDGCQEVLDKLKENHNLYIVSNGVKVTQDVRLEKAGLTHYFKKIFLSEVIGYNKPDPRYFDYVKANIDDFSSENTLLIGDNLFSDINGAIQANIKCVYFNFHHQPNNTCYKANYEIGNLKELFSI